MKIEPLPVVGIMLQFFIATDECDYGK